MNLNRWESSYVEGEGYIELITNRLGLGIKYFGGCLSLDYLADEPKESGEVRGKEARKGTLAGLLPWAQGASSLEAAGSQGQTQAPEVWGRRAGIITHQFPPIMFEGCVQACSILSTFARFWFGQRAGWLCGARHWKHLVDTGWWLLMGYRWGATGNARYSDQF